jgi:ABC-type glycerol-3-phosphate transport system substrate-binding protein
MKQQWFWICFAAMSALLGTLANQVAAQTPIITVALPVFWQGLIDDDIVADFEAEYGVDVQFEFNNQAPENLPTSLDDIEDYVQDLTNYLSSADVVYTEAGGIAPEVTRAGFVYDLMPLISADSSLNPSDFYAAAWNSYQWDSGFWAIPIAAQPLLIDYNVDAFDAAALAYPTSAWTMDDFAFAARALTQYDEAGNVTLAAMVIDASSRNVLFHALLGEGFYDTSVFPEQPKFDNPALASLLETWNELLAEGVIVTNAGDFFDRFNEIPLQMGGGGRFAISVSTDSEGGDDAPPPDFNFDEDAPTRALAPLPNNQNVVAAVGFAVSAGTANPELAYALARYLSELETLANAAFGAEPARLSYAPVEEVDNGTTVTIFGGERSPEDQALVDDAMANGLPLAEMRFSQYLNLAFDYISSGSDATTALETAELDALAIIEEMDALEIVLTVATPVPVVLAEGEIEISFGYQSFVQPLPNEAEWDDLIADFVAQDPELGSVNMELTGPRFGNSEEDAYDCSYYPSTQFIDIDPELLYAIDPLMFSDANYNVNDLAAGALETVQVDGITYGLPITIQPSMLQYNPESFAQAGLTEPIGGWTVSEFGDALAALTSTVAEGEAPFLPGGFGNQYLLMLIAAQGGLPIDYSTRPPTINFTDPTTVEAIRAVLDWAKAGYIEYQELGATGGGIAIRIDDSIAAPLSSTFFAGFANPNVRMTTYPRGSTYIPVSYDVGAGYINKTSAYPEACYRWLSYLATHPAVVTGSMPALLSTMNQPEVQDALGLETVAAYQTVAEMLADPNAVQISFGDPFMATWLNRAFDAYVLEDADLLTALQDAQQPTLDYLACAGNLELNRLNFQAIQDCVTAADSGT